MPMLDVSIQSRPGAGCWTKGPDNLVMLMLITDQTGAGSDGALAAPFSQQFGSEIALSYASVYFKALDSPPQNQTFIASRCNFLLLTHTDL